MSTDGRDVDVADVWDTGLHTFNVILRDVWISEHRGDARRFARALESLKRFSPDFDTVVRKYFRYLPVYTTCRSWDEYAARAERGSIGALLMNLRAHEMFDWIMASFARSGDVRVLEWALFEADPKLINGSGDIICEEAARRGRVNVLKFARLDHDCHWDENTPRLAALGGHSQCLKFAYKNGCRFNAEVTRAAVRGGKLNCLRYLHEVVKCPWDEGSCIAAAEGGRFDCLQYLRKHGCECSEATFTAAARVGQLETLKYLHANDCPYSSQASIAAAENGHLEALKFLHEHGYVFSPDVTKIAARLYLDCVRYLVETLGYDITWSEVVEMMRHGSLDCLEYAFENVGDIFREHGASLCLHAAMEGQESSLKFIIERVGAPKEWISSTCAVTAHEGHLTCLEYLHKHGCPVDEQVSCSAAEGGQLECLKFAMKHTKPVYEILESAARNGHLDCLRYAYEHGCPLEEGLLNAAVESKTDLSIWPNCIDYLHYDLGFAWDEETCIRAARVGNVGVLRCLHENFCPWDTRLLATDSEACRNYAIENGVLGDIEHVLRGNFLRKRLFNTPITPVEKYLREAMRVIDDVKTSIPEGKYLEICSALQSAYGEPGELSERLRVLKIELEEVESENVELREELYTYRHRVAQQVPVGISPPLPDAL
jgi:hypothetical protein